ncbi:MarR family winged helix-turn-helix transcriptional regulator [Rhodococcus phenolicus]|uniref:MarR family winged helix-turn-helix transcriptional regulator n=1 Tax=Rhodococcus phenolicus TaxID=263849 RepID=UPI000AD1DC75|nr:MarR family transcriptional regulator [Rhodococcus phenolicus]
MGTDSTRFENDEIARLRVTFGKIARRVDRRSSGEDGLTRTQFSLLSTVARHEEIGVREVAEIEGLNPTMLSRMLGKLEDAGLLTRSPDPGDKRVVRARITDAGRERFLHLREVRTALFAENLAALSDEHSDAIRRALPALEALAESMADAGCRP